MIKTKGEVSKMKVTALLGAAVGALRSYQYGNSSTDLAEEVANKIEEFLDNQAERTLPRGVKIK
jgi:hypothetical protein